MDEQGILNQAVLPLHHLNLNREITLEFFSSNHSDPWLALLHWQKSLDAILCNIHSTLLSLDSSHIGLSSSMIPLKAELLQNLDSTRTSSQALISLEQRKLIIKALEFLIVVSLLAPLMCFKPLQGPILKLLVRLSTKFPFFTELPWHERLFPINDTVPIDFISPPDWFNLLFLPPENSNSWSQITWISIIYYLPELFFYSSFLHLLSSSRSPQPNSPISAPFTLWFNQIPISDTIETILFLLNRIFPASLSQENDTSVVHSTNLQISLLHIKMNHLCSTFLSWLILDKQRLGLESFIRIMTENQRENIQVVYHTIVKGLLKKPSWKSGSLGDYYLHLLALFYPIISRFYSSNSGVPSNNSSWIDHVMNIFAQLICHWYKVNPLFVQNEILLVFFNPLLKWYKILFTKNDLVQELDPTSNLKNEITNSDAVTVDIASAHDVQFPNSSLFIKILYPEESFNRIYYFISLFLRSIQFPVPQVMQLDCHHSSTYTPNLSINTRILSQTPDKPIYFYQFPYLLLFYSLLEDRRFFDDISWVYPDEKLFMVFICDLLLCHYKYLDDPQWSRILNSLENRGYIVPLFLLLVSRSLESNSEDSNQSTDFLGVALVLENILPRMLQLLAGDSLLNITNKYFETLLGLLEKVVLTASCSENYVLDSSSLIDILLSILSLNLDHKDNVPQLFIDRLQNVLDQLPDTILNRFIKDKVMKPKSATSPKSENSDHLSNLNINEIDFSSIFLQLEEWRKKWTQLTDIPEIGQWLISFHQFIVFNNSILNAGAASNNCSKKMDGAFTENIYSPSNKLLLTIMENYIIDVALCHSDSYVYLAAITCLATMLKVLPSIVLVPFLSKCETVAKLVIFYNKNDSESSSSTTSSNLVDKKSIATRNNKETNLDDTSDKDCVIEIWERQHQVLVTLFELFLSKRTNEMPIWFEQNANTLFVFYRTIFHNFTMTDQGNFSSYSSENEDKIYNLRGHISFMASLSCYFHVFSPSVCFKNESGLSLYLNFCADELQKNIFIINSMNTLPCPPKCISAFSNNTTKSSSKGTLLISEISDDGVHAGDKEVQEHQKLNEIEQGLRREYMKSLIQFSCTIIEVFANDRSFSMKHLFMDSLRRIYKICIDIGKVLFVMQDGVFVQNCEKFVALANLLFMNYLELE